MPWADGHIRVNHPRESWDGGPEEIAIHSALAFLKGKKGTSARKAYHAAKRGFDMDAAFEVVERTVSKPAMDFVVSHIISAGCKARIIIPHPEFDDEEKHGDPGMALTNAIPFAFANFLKRVTNQPVDEEIVQVARVGRTKLSKWQRFLYQPSFGGAVRTDVPYILVDDVASTGGTLAALRSFIVRNGGKVLCATTLANGVGQNQPFPITDETGKSLREAVGAELEPFWLETFGHRLDCLTESEGRFLKGWCDETAEQAAGGGEPLLQRLRAKFDQVASS